MCYTIGMSNKRSYSDGCGAAHAMDLVGERWALLVVRELMLGPKRFTDLRASLPTISPNVLTQRLGVRNWNQRCRCWAAGQPVRPSCPRVIP